MTRVRFPAGFLWGASTSSHQVEGDNCWNDWWEYEQSGRLPHASGKACCHYHLFESDFDLARSWGHNAHRFSIEWSRIEPSEGSWNEHALQHYVAVITALRKRRLEPIVTLHHFTNPAWFSRRGGWLCSDSPGLFGRYVEYVVSRLGNQVKYWITINEPTVLVMQGYINGEWPPLLRKAWTKAAAAFRNLARAHVVGYRIIHQNSSAALVGFAHSTQVIEPCDRARMRDRIAARLRDSILNYSFFYLIGMLRLDFNSTTRAASGNTTSDGNADPRFEGGAGVCPREVPNRINRETRPTAKVRLPSVIGGIFKKGRTLDFLGLNYYTRTVVRGTGKGAKFFLGEVCRVPHHAEGGPISSIGWEVYPVGLKRVLKRFSEFRVPLLVTENGIATDDELLRSQFIENHINGLVSALSEGVPVFGYLYWSLIDNFEWAIGTEARFGLAAVDFNTQERTERPCVKLFKRVCLDNAWEHDELHVGRSER